MKVIKHSIPDVFEIVPQKFVDERGHFTVPYDKAAYEKNDLPSTFVQDNESFSKKGTLRGLHFQKPPFMQGKLVRVISGVVQDIIVDLRIGSPTYRQWAAFIISAEKGNVVYVPEGFAHGFLALEDTIFSYKCTQLYNKASEGGIHWADEKLSLPWQLEGIDPLVSDKDTVLPSLEEVCKEFIAYYSS